MMTMKKKRLTISTVRVTALAATERQAREATMSEAKRARTTSPVGDDDTLQVRTTQRSCALLVLVLVVRN